VLIGALFRNLLENPGQKAQGEKFIGDGSIQNEIATHHQRTKKLKKRVEFNAKGDKRDEEVLPNGKKREWALLPSGSNSCIKNLPESR